ncbi:hypothetical protein CKAH01_02169 [Colletotrichum kahawae]|uniref:Uncharacterized protein n=1 Tax=Colletotrichum kahawae TaxID=34407 RepID=A0AAE0D026_COLKA|nr:hypothetical protein CKAH01_02169 [Colletotrichum kahawae]
MSTFAYNTASMVTMKKANNGDDFPTDPRWAMELPQHKTTMSYMNVVGLAAIYWPKRWLHHDAASGGSAVPTRW